MDAEIGTGVRLVADFKQFLCQGQSLFERLIVC